jgi:nucleotidyltransferase substrate binding protein (TIGR01987 family)
MPVSFEKIEKALHRLEEGLQNEPKSDLERDGVIQRFEYTIEALWKISKKVLLENGISANTPKETIKEMAKANWISNPEEFIEFLKMRNETSHTYEELKAQEVYKASKAFAPKCRELLNTLKSKA